jgi:hypothetical protein
MTKGYQALDLLTDGGYAPLVARREPYWRPRPVKPNRSVHLPAWLWESVHKTEAGTELVDLDINGAYLAALSSGDYAHGALERQEPNDDRKLRPGYYQITVPPWQVPGICSPLGTVDIGSTAWIMHPTLKLLQDLSDVGYVPDIEVRDSYTAATSCRFRKWAERMRDDRAAIIDDRAAAPLGSVAHAAAEKRYVALKDSYAMAIQMMRGVENEDGEQQARKSKVLRPDWYATVHAQHAATMWRKVWNAHQSGYGPAAMGSTDMVTFTADDWAAIQALPRPPFRIDESTKSLGSFKVKPERVAL